MSWAEIKKAVNSDLSEPLNEKLANTETELKEQFGLHKVRGGHATTAFSVSGFEGFLVFGKYSSMNWAVSIDDVDSARALNTSSAFWDVLPISKSTTVSFKPIGTNDPQLLYYVLAWGGVSKLLKNLFSKREEVLA